MPESPEGKGVVKIVEGAKGSGLPPEEIQDLKCELAYGRVCP